MGATSFKQHAVWLFLAFMVVTESISCKKQAVDITPPSQVLTGTRWQVRNLYLQSQSDPSKTEARAFTYKACELDDIYEFKKGGVFVRSDSLSKCDPMDLDPFHVNVFGPYGQANWSADSLFTQIVIISPGFYRYTWKVTALTTQRFEVEENYTDYLSNKLVYTYSFNPVK